MVHRLRQTLPFLTNESPHLDLSKQLEMLPIKELLRVFHTREGKPRLSKLTL